MTTPKIEHTLPIPEKHSRRWKALALSMKVEDHVTCQTPSDMQALANALTAVGFVPRINKSTLTVWRRL